MVIVTHYDPATDARQLWQHVTNLDVLRSLLGDVRWAIWEIGDEQAAFGTVCSDLVEALSGSQARQHKLVAYVEESLLLMVQGLRRVAGGDVELKEILRRSSGPDVMTLDGTPVIEEPEDRAPGLMDTVIAQVQRLEWVEPHLVGAAPVAEFAARTDESYTALRVAALRCALTGADGLADLLTDVTGKPEQVAGRAGAWAAISTDLMQLGRFLRECLDDDELQRDRLDVRSYLAMMSNNVHVLLDLAEITNALSIVTKAAGDLILLTGDIIRGIIADLYAQAAVWITESSRDRGRPALSAQLGIVVAGVWRIQSYLDALADSMTELSRSIDG